MRGISIGYIPRDVGSIWPEPAQPPIPSLPADVSAFCSFFRPIFPLLSEYYWYASGYWGTPFGTLNFEEGGEERFEAAIVECALDESISQLLFRPGTLPELASYLASDWVSLIGLRGPVQRAIDVALRLERTADFSPMGPVKFDQIVEEESDLAIYCIDGFIWELYAKDQETLDRVESPLRSFAGVTLEWRESAERGKRF